MKLEKEENDLNVIRMKFTNMQEELDFKNDKLSKIWERLQQANGELSQINEDFDRERNDMYDTIYELTNQLKLKNMIIEDFVPPEEYKKYEKIAEWNEEVNDWTIRNPNNFKDIKTGSKRP